jgi:hypothetical protein
MYNFNNHSVEIGFRAAVPAYSRAMAFVCVHMYSVQFSAIKAALCIKII